AQHEVRRRHVRTLPVRPALRVQGRPGVSPRSDRRIVRAGGILTVAAKPRLGVFKLASCDGCQLTLLDLEDQLLSIAGAIDVVHFPEASSAMNEHGPFDLTLVEGSVSTPEQAEEIGRIRASSRYLVTIGACATWG